MLTAIVMRTTALGVAIHAAGIEPRAVDKSGLSVTRIRHLVVLFAGFMAALAGAFLSIGDIHTFTEGMTRGAGYLAIAAVIFGKWKILGATFRLLTVWRRNGNAVPAPGARHRRAQRAAHHDAISSGVARGRRPTVVGRQTALAEPHRRA